MSDTPSRRQSRLERQQYAARYLHRLVELGSQTRELSRQRLELRPEQEQKQDQARSQGRQR